MKQITIGDKPLMQISKEDILEIAIMQGCCACLEYWNRPVLLGYDNTMFSDNVWITYRSERKSDGLKSDILVFFFYPTDLHYNHHREDLTVNNFGRRISLEGIKFLIEKGYDVPIY